MLMINAWILIYEMRQNEDIFFFPRGSNMNNQVRRAYICIHDAWRTEDVLIEWATHHSPLQGYNVQRVRDGKSKKALWFCCVCVCVFVLLYESTECSRKEDGSQHYRGGISLHLLPSSRKRDLVKSSCSVRTSFFLGRITEGGLAVESYKDRMFPDMQSAVLSYGTGLKRHANSYSGVYC